MCLNSPSSALATMERLVFDRVWVTFVFRSGSKMSSLLTFVGTIKQSSTTSSLLSVLWLFFPEALSLGIFLLKVLDYATPALNAIRFPFRLDWLPSSIDVKEEPPKSWRGKVEEDIEIVGLLTVE